MIEHHQTKSNKGGRIRNLGLDGRMQHSGRSNPLTRPARHAMNTPTPTTSQKQPIILSAAFRASLIALAAVLLTAQQGRAQETVGDLGDWLGYQISGFDIDGTGGDTTIGQTFQIDDGNALVSSISVPVVDADTVGTAEFQIGVAAWSGTQATGTLLYLSSVMSESSTSFQTFTVSPNNLVLNQNQEYVLFVTANGVVDSYPPFNGSVGYVPVGDYAGGDAFNVTGYQFGINDLFTQTWHDAEHRHGLSS